MDRETKELLEKIYHAQIITIAQQISMSKHDGKIQSLDFYISDAINKIRSMTPSIQRNRKDLENL